LLGLGDVGYIGGKNPCPRFQHILLRSVLAPLKEQPAQLIAAHSTLTPYIGSTEAGSFICNRLPNSITGYIGLNSTAMGIVWEDAGDDLFEPVIKRNALCSKYQGVFHSFPDRDEWRMGDLYSRHATEPDVWKYEGRRDETIILNHGENIAPATLECRFRAVPGVEHALLIGNQRPALAILIQTTPTQTAEEEVSARVWQTVQSLNEAVGPLAKIQKQRILFADEARRVILTKKGAVSRKRTLAMYTREIEQLYV
jgi:acyl-coenzyme A synthetase/AMP-(fatty) acid ligase